MNYDNQNDKYKGAFWSMLGLIICLVYLILKNNL